MTEDQRIQAEAVERVDTAGLRGETFTQRCRRLLTEQPGQTEFKISRVGVEVLVSDSERYGALNAKLSEEAAAHKRLYPDPASLDEQTAKVAEKWPGAILHPSQGKRGDRWLEVPVALPKGYRKCAAKMFVRVPDGYPWTAPHRFYLPLEDSALEHGGAPKCTSMPQEIDGRTLTEFFWKICRWEPRHMDLYVYVKSMERGLIACAQPY